MKVKPNYSPVVTARVLKLTISFEKTTCSRETHFLSGIGIDFLSSVYIGLIIQRFVYLALISQQFANSKNVVFIEVVGCIDDDDLVISIRLFATILGRHLCEVDFVLSHQLGYTVPDIIYFDRFEKDIPLSTK